MSDNGQGSMNDLTKEPSVGTGSTDDGKDNGMAVEEAVLKKSKALEESPDPIWRNRDKRHDDPNDVNFDPGHEPTPSTSEVSEHTSGDEGRSLGPDFWRVCTADVQGMMS